MDLLRDILDKQIVDRKQVRIGKVDGLVAELRKDRPPRIIAIELGSITLARRLGARPGRWMAWLAARLGGERHAGPHHIAWKKVRDIGVDIEVDIDVRRTAILDWQVWLRDRVIGRIPGA
jgi:sporulation protein YlmC with PRC-barrel domain